MTLIDFTDCVVNPYKAYGGANGAKIGIIYKGKQYMLKFQQHPRRSKTMRYTNSIISEHLGSTIFNLLGIPAQETLLGVYKDKPVVACMDFEEDGFRLFDFASIKNTVIDSVHEGYGTELDSILQAIEEQVIVSSIELKNFFWRMFVVDAFLGNFDRHNGNWGFLLNNDLEYAKIAPIYDCGSCLFPEMDEQLKESVISVKEELENRLYVYPTSAIHNEGKKIGYFDFLRSNRYSECTNALIDIVGKIDMTSINKIVDSVPIINVTDKTFYKYILQARKEYILEKALHEITGLRKMPF